MKALNIQQVAEKSLSGNAVWRSQATVADGETTPSPLAGRRFTVVFPTALGVGDSVSLDINGTTVSSTYSASGAAGFSALSTAVLAQAGVAACRLKASATYAFWRCLDGNGAQPTEDQTGIGLEVIFEEGAASNVGLSSGSVPDGTVVADTTEGVSVAGTLRAIVHLPVGAVPASESINTDQILLTANGAYRGTDGNSLEFEVIEAGTSTALSIEVSGTTITVNLETDGSGNAVSTSEEVLQALQRDEAVAELVLVAAGSGYVASQVIAAEAATSLAGGANGSVNGDLWAMLDDGAADGSGNYWVLCTPTAITGTLNDPTSTRVDCSEYAYLYWRVTATTGDCTPRIGLCGGAQ